MQIFHAAVGLKSSGVALSSSKPAPPSTNADTKLNLALTIACLEFLDKHADSLLAPRKTLETAEIIKCMHHVVRNMLL